MPSFIQKTCTNCKACEPICPTKSIIPGNDQYVIDTDTCEDCGVCIAICPVKAILSAALKNPGTA